MPSYNLSTRGRVADLVTGLRVDKASIAIAAISTKSLFNVEGGNCLILGLVGEVTTIIQNQANNTKFISTPDTGTAVDLCTVVDIANLEVGGFLSIPGAVGSAATKTNAGAAQFVTTPLVVAPGVIGVDTAANNTGAMKFSIWYVPLEEGAYIEAA